MDNFYDIIIVGGGPAGISAAIYAKRAGRNVAVIEKFVPGGQLSLIGEIENYAGFARIEGSDLANKFYEHAKSLDIPFIMDEVVDYDLNGDIKEVKCKRNSYKAYSIIIAVGSHSKELNIEGEKEYKGRGVSYCALCDGNFFKNKDVAVVGSGDSAFSDALYLSNICNKVYVLTKSNLKLHNYAENEFDDKENVVILRGALSKKIEGETSLKKLYFEQNNEEKNIDVDGVFVAIGRSPDTGLLKDKVDLNASGYINTDSLMKTNIEGVFACGDVRSDSMKQIATAVGDGAIAGNEASKYVLRKLYSKNKN